MTGGRRRTSGAADEKDGDVLGALAVFEKRGDVGREFAEHLAGGIAERIAEGFFDTNESELFAAALTAL